MINNAGTVDHTGNCFLHRCEWFVQPTSKMRQVLDPFDLQIHLALPEIPCGILVTVLNMEQFFIKFKHLEILTVTLFARH